MNRFLVLSSVALATAGLLAVTATSATAAKKRRKPFKGEKNLVVTLVTPTNNQEVLPDLSDPALGGRITVRFSSSLRRGDIIDNQNVTNQLTNKVEFLDSSFQRLEGSPTVRANVLEFNPFPSGSTGMLPQGQYTLNIKRSLRNRRGRPLNRGVSDFTTTFSVGTDVYFPVLRKISPINDQQNIGLNQRVVATFNEPIDVASTVSTIQVQNASTNPPTLIPGAGTTGTGISLERGGFDVVFTPNPCFGYPPRTQIQFLMQGQIMIPNGGTSSPVTDVFGNGFARDNDLRWTPDPAVANLFNSPNGSYNEATGIFRMQFRTKGTRPAPNGLIPGSAQSGMPVTSTPCSGLAFFAPSCAATGRVLFYTTGNGLGEISLIGFINRFNQGVIDFSQLSLLANTPVRVGRIGGVVVDRRWDPNLLHTYIYAVDQRTATVAVLDSRNLKTLGRFAGFSAPRDVTISTDGSLTRSALWVSDFASNTAVGVDLQSFRVNFGGQPGAPSVCEAINDVRSDRIVVQTGKGPTGIAADSFFNSRVLVANTLDDSMTVFNPSNGDFLNTYTVGSTPVDLDFSFFQGNTIRVAMIANQGGLNDPNGSVSLFVNSPSLGGGFLGAAQTRDGIESTLTDRVKNPTDVWGNQEWYFPPSQRSIPNQWFVPNTGEDNVLTLVVSIQGLFGLSVTPSIASTIDTGLNPTGAVFDPFYPNAFVFVGVAGTGQVGGLDPARPLDPVYTRVPGIRRLFTTFRH